MPEPVRQSADREGPGEREVAFSAWEYRSDQGFDRVRHNWRGSEAEGWTIRREGRPDLALGPGFRPLRSRACGVCSTDLDRHHLPFPLPQVTGHEVVVEDAAGARLAVEINASHRARGIAAGCAFCERGLDSHCPDRRVLGIHDLPGGFGPWVLAPVGGLVPLPDAVPDDVALLLEPFAAALHGVDLVAPRAGDTVAVLGPRRLGLLAVAALAARRRERGGDFEILALARHDALLEKARRLGATRTRRVDERADGPLADVVIDTTGTPEGLELALGLAGREVHLKSTHGRPAAGLAGSTAFVVDELRLERAPDHPAAALAGVALDPARPRLAWLSADPPPEAPVGAHCAVGADALALRDALEAEAGPGELPRADAAVVDSLADADRAIRPSRSDERSLLRPRGVLWLRRSGREAAPLARAVRERGLVLSSSRCGDFRRALALLAADRELHRLGTELLTHRLPEARLPEAFATARSRACIKAVVEHERG